MSDEPTVEHPPVVEIRVVCAQCGGNLNNIGPKYVHALQPEDHPAEPTPA